MKKKNILYLLGYPKEFNEMRIPILKMYDKLLANSLNVREKWQSLANNQFDNCQILH